MLFVLRLNQSVTCMMAAVCWMCKQFKTSLLQQGNCYRTAIRLEGTMDPRALDVAWCRRGGMGGMAEACGSGLLAMAMGDVCLKTALRRQLQAHCLYMLTVCKPLQTLNRWQLNKQQGVCRQQQLQPSSRHTAADWGSLHLVYQQESATAALMLTSASGLLLRSPAEMRCTTGARYAPPCQQPATCPRCSWQHALCDGKHIS